ncbi:hypothetical protein HX776_24790 [Pseudomonas agarici]|nr:hypothetical protein [Pseudomonas agarici]NWC12007.1 hypothetical protein [Pseudomonas agarici]SEL93579.1 hypothetical protein SAMN05216604_1713 [Pseudomonas agarici]
MNETDRKAVEGTRADTAKVLDNKQPYSPEVAMSQDSPRNTYATIDNEKALADVDKQTGTLSSTKNKGRQMSHLWIKKSLFSETTIPPSHKAKLLTAIREAERSLSNIILYNREVFMVTGKQYEIHDRSKGVRHNIQFPIITIPDHILDN